MREKERKSRERVNRSKRLIVGSFITVTAVVLIVLSIYGEADAAQNVGRLNCRHISEKDFNFAINNARDYDAKAFTELTAGVVPHHLTAAPMIGGFFRAAAEKNQGGASFDTVIIVGPNHFQKDADVVVSLKGWDAPGGADCDEEVVGKILGLKLPDAIITEDDECMENDHAVSALVPFVNKYWPEARVAPVLVSGTLAYANTLALADGLTEIIESCDKRVLLLCSIDFSHYLTPAEARARDAQTLTEIKSFGYGAIHKFTDANVDSPASLNIFLRYLENTGGKLSVVDNADASAFTDTGAEGTTSYFILTGTRE